MFEFTFITALNIVILMWQFGYNIVTVTTYQFNQVRISFRHIRLPLVKLQSGEGSYSQILRSFAQIDVDSDVSYLAHFLILQMISDQDPFLPEANMSWSFLFLSFQQDPEHPAQKYHAFPIMILYLAKRESSMLKPILFMRKLR